MSCTMTSSLTVRQPNLSSRNPGVHCPELVEGQTPSTASDIYSFGVLCYEVLTGRRPFEGSVGELLGATSNRRRSLHRWFMPGASGT